MLTLRLRGYYVDWPNRGWDRFVRTSVFVLLPSILARNGNIYMNYNAGLKLSQYKNVRGENWDLQFGRVVYRYSHWTKLLF